MCRETERTEGGGVWMGEASREVSSGVTRYAG